MTKTVVVLGASYAGLGVAHKLLKASRRSIPDLKVILVSPTTHLYWNMASVRAVVPDTIPDADISKPLAAGFAAYPPDAFELVIGSASAHDASAKTVTVTVPPSSSADADPQTRTVPYDVLVVATGARSLDPSMPWKADGSHDACLARLHSVRTRLTGASRVVVAGAGATGVELAAEIGYAYGKEKQVVLLSGGPQILGGDSIAGSAEGELAALGVEVRKDARVRETRVQEDGAVEVVLEAGPAGEGDAKAEEGEVLVCDLYLPTMGQRPNTEFLAKELLTQSGYLDVDECFRSKGAKDVFGVGDVVSRPRAGFVITDWHSPQAAHNVELALSGGAPKPVSNMPAEIFFTATGPKRGAGRVGWVKVPSFAVYLGKGKTLGIERVPKYVDGSRW